MRRLDREVMNKYTNQDILQIAMKQSALDINCDPADFLKSENVVVRSGVGPLARKYALAGQPDERSRAKDLFYGRIFSAGYEKT